MTLKEYTEQQGVSIKELSEITGVPLPQLYRIARDRDHNATIKTMVRIAAGTAKAFGKPLLPSQYLNVSAILGEI